MKTSFEVVSIVDNDDGSAMVVLEMDFEMLKIFASIGLMEVLLAKATEADDGHFDGKGESDPPTGT